MTYLNTASSGAGLKISAFAWSVALLGLALAPLSAAAQKLLREAHFDGTDVVIRDPHTGYRLLTERGQTFHIPFMGVAKEPWLTTSVSQDGQRSLGITIGPSEPGQTHNDRTEFTIAHQDDRETLHLGEDRYFGFAIYFNEHDFPVPTAQIIISQFWQPYSKNGTGPPAYLVMTPDANDLSFQLATRNDESTKSTAVPLTDAHFVRGRWNSVVIHALPRPTGDPAGPGVIEVWLNGKYLGGAHRFWGYSPSNGNSKNTFDVRAGMYANPEAVSHTIWIDDLRWGTSRESVDTGMHSVKPPS